jgi:hypothetical protein
MNPSRQKQRSGPRRGVLRPIRHRAFAYLRAHPHTIFAKRFT